MSLLLTLTLVAAVGFLVGWHTRGVYDCSAAEGEEDDCGFRTGG